jgi:hypothetical protein
MRSQSFRIRTGNFILRAEHALRHLLPMRRMNAASAERNYSFNNGRDIRSRTVNDQSDGKNTGVALLRLGDTVMKESGCEVIAAYNALLLLGKPVSFADTARLFEEKGCLMRFPFVKYGTLGVNPYDIGGVMESCGIACSHAEPGQMCSDGLYIISYWNSPKLKDGLHTITVRTTDGICCTYNYTMRGHSGSVMPASDFLETFSAGYITGYRLDLKH